MAAIIVPIEEITFAALQDGVREALAGESEADTIADLVASVDWAGHDRAAAPVRALLGELEAWTVDYEEGQLSPVAYRARLESVLPAVARA